MHAPGRAIWLRQVVLVVMLCAATVSMARAQPPRTASSDLGDALVPGATVWITDSTGREEKMRIVDVSGESVTVSADGEVRRLRTADIRRIRARRSDSVLNGALIGAGAGIASGLFMCRLTEPWEICNDPGPLFGVGAIGAGAGIAIDALIRGRRTIYETPRGATLHVAPLVGRHARGLQISVVF